MSNSENDVAQELLEESSTNPNLIPITQIFDREFKNVFYNQEKKEFFIKRKNKRVKSVHDLRRIPWNVVRPKYTNKSGVEHVYSYRFVLIPHGKKYVRVKEGELEEYQKTLEAVIPPKEPITV
jgi:hypothetical protein